MVSAAAASAIGEYTDTMVEFSPDVTITVPAFDDDEDDLNDFAGAAFVVTFTRVEGSDEGCNATESESWVVSDSGAVVRTSLAAVLVGSVAGATDPCQYDVVPTLTGTGLIRDPDEPEMMMVSSAAASATATYLNTESEFSPMFAFTVPFFDFDGDGNNDFNGQTIEVFLARVEGSNEECTEEPAMLIWSIPVGRGAAIIQDTADAVLVNRPQGAASRCEYTATLGGSLDSRSDEYEGELFPDLGGVIEAVTAGTELIEVTFSFDRTSFSPAIAISVPNFDDDGDGVNDFSGSTFEFSFTPVAGSVGLCTTGATETRAVGDDGSVALMGEAAILLDSTETQEIGEPTAPVNMM